jgi:hypothetical protein
MPRPITASDRRAPGGVKLAAALFALYGVSAFVNAAVVLRGGGWGSPRGWVPVLIQVIGAGIVAWGLLRGRRWAWWLGLAMGVFWLAAGALTTLVVQRDDLYWLPPSGFQLVLAGSLVCLGAAVAMLLTPGVRAVFRRPAV